MSSLSLSWSCRHAHLRETRKCTSVYGTKRKKKWTRIPTCPYFQRHVVESTTFFFFLSFFFAPSRRRLSVSLERSHAPSLSWTRGSWRTRCLIQRTRGFPWRRVSQWMATLCIPVVRRLPKVGLIFVSDAPKSPFVL